MTYTPKNRSEPEAPIAAYLAKGDKITKCRQRRERSFG